MRDSEHLFLGVVRAAAPGVASGLAVPSPVPAKFIWVRRTGGPTMGRVVDRPQMAVTCWGGNKTDAMLLAEVARQALLDSPRGSNGVHSVEILSFYYDPDPDSRKDRYTVNAITNVRAARS